METQSGGGRITRHHSQEAIMSLDNNAANKFAELDEGIAQAKAAADLTKISGYDKTKTQTLKNDSGTLKWVTDEA